MNEGMTSSSGPTQNYFSSSIDLDWHNSPEGRGVLAHLTDQSNGQRRNYGIQLNYKSSNIFRKCF